MLREFENPYADEYPSYVCWTTRNVGTGAESGMGKAVISGLMRYGVVLRMTKSDVVLSSLEAHLPFYIHPPSGSQVRVVEWWAKVRDFATPTFSPSDVWPIILEDATGLFDGCGLALGRSILGADSCLFWWRSGGGGWGSQAIPITWNIYDWNLYRIEWDTAQQRVYVNGGLLDAENNVVTAKLLPAAEITITEVNPAIPTELDAFFDIHNVIRNLKANMVTLI